MENAIFVYGSLMTGFWNYDKSLNGHVKKVVPAKVRGSLYHLTHKGYPALIAGDDWVYGEYMVVNNLEDLKPILNKIESYYGPNDPRNEYEHILMPIYDLEATVIGEAPVYHYNTDLDVEFLNKRIYIPHGSWRQFMEEK